MKFCIVYGLNLFDLACTLYARHIGAAELNPFMQSVQVMILYKTVFVGGLLAWLASRPEQAAQWGIRISTAAYAGLCIWHCMGICMML